jgi:hypothetical protein
MTEQIDLAGALTVPAGDIGAPGRLDPARCATRAMELLCAAAGETMTLASFSLEMGSVEAVAGDDVAIHVATDKRTRAIAFLSLEGRIGAAVAFTARAVFSARSA